jgi:hypothetical protein
MPTKIIFKKKDKKLQAHYKTFKEVLEKYSDVYSIDPEVRIKAAEGIDQKGLHLLAKDEDSEVRIKVAERIDQKGLHLLAKDPNYEVRWEAAERIDQKGLYLLAKDKNTMVRTKVAECIDQKGLRLMAKDESHLIKTLVAERLKNIKLISPSAIDKFSKTFKLTSKDIPKAMQEVIKSIDGKDKIAELSLEPIDELYKPTKLWGLHTTARKEWLDSSNSKYALFLKKAISKLYGGSIYHHDAVVDTDEYYAKGLKQYGIEEKDLDNYVKAQKALTKVLLGIKYPKQKEFVLYRGTTVTELEEEEKLEVGKTLAIKQNSLSSWTLRKATAAIFGNIIIEAVFSKNDVFSCFLTHSYSGYEAEFMVIGKPGKKGKVVKVK